MQHVICGVLYTAIHLNVGHFDGFWTEQVLYVMLNKNVKIH